MYIQVNPRDNVGIIVDPEGFKAREHIPQSHKMALRDLAAGEPVLRYGSVIGSATRAIPARPVLNSPEQLARWALALRLAVRRARSRYPSVKHERVSLGQPCGARGLPEHRAWRRGKCEHK